MCLNLDKFRTQEMKEFLEKSGSVSVYKCFQVDYSKTKIKNIFMQTEPDIDKEGFIKSTRESRDLSESEVNGLQVSLGVHAYLTSAKADSLLLEMPGRNFVVECVGHKDDFVACSDEGHVVFTKILVNLENLKLAFDVAKNRPNVCCGCGVDRDNCECSYDEDDDWEDEDDEDEDDIWDDDDDDDWDETWEDEDDDEDDDWDDDDEDD